LLRDPTLGSEVLAMFVRVVFAGFASFRTSNIGSPASAATSSRSPVGAGRSAASNRSTRTIDRMPSVSRAGRRTKAVADVSRRGLLDADRALRREGLSAAPLVQILDGVLFEVPASELADAARASEAMRNAFVLEAPLRVGIEVGPNWADLEPMPA